MQTIITTKDRQEIVNNLKTELERHTEVTVYDLTKILEYNDIRGEVFEHSSIAFDEHASILEIDDMLDEITHHNMSMKTIPSSREFKEWYVENHPDFFVIPWEDMTITVLFK